MAENLISNPFQPFLFPNSGPNRGGAGCRKQPRMLSVPFFGVYPIVPELTQYPRVLRPLSTKNLAENFQNRHISAQKLVFPDIFDCF